MIKDISELNPALRYSYADYLLWQFKERVELIKGKVMQMSAPSTLHQKISVNLRAAIKWHLKKSECQVFAAPFDVRLTKAGAADDKIDTVVQPDICVICNTHLLDEKGCMGAPDMIVEILSPGNSKREVRDKFELYQENLVKEYWIIYPAEQVLQRYLLNEHLQYHALPPNTPGDTVGISVLPGFELAVSDIFE